MVVHSACSSDGNGFKRPEMEAWEDEAADGGGSMQVGGGALSTLTFTHT